MQGVGFGDRTPPAQVPALADTSRLPPVHVAAGSPHPQAVHVRVSVMPVSMMTGTVIASYGAGHPPPSEEAGSAMQRRNDVEGLGTHTWLEPQLVRVPVAAQPSALSVHVAGGTVGIWGDAGLQLPPCGVEETSR